MLTVEQAQKKLIDSISPITQIKTVSLNRALQRVIARTYRAEMNVPPADSSAMDGFVVNSADIASIPITLPLSQRIVAGHAPAPLQAGTAARIFTGAQMPANGDAVVIQENCETGPNSTVTIRSLVSKWDNVRRAGLDLEKNAVLFKQGHRLRPQDLALIASTGIAEIDIVKKPTIGIFGTGSELVEPGKTLSPGQIYNSNKYLLCSLLEKLNCKVFDYGIVPDNLDKTIKALRECHRNSDLIITTGGVSAGEEDYVKEAVSRLGHIDFWKVLLKPGKPIAVGEINSKKILGLPGNPVSVYVTFLLFALPAIQTLSGQHYCGPQKIEMPIGFSIDRPLKRPEYIRVRIAADSVERFANQSSGVFSSVTWANALAYIPAETILQRGDNVATFPLDSFFN